MTAKRRLCIFIVVGLILGPRLSSAQVLTGTLSGTVKDESGGVLPGASVRLSSPALIGATSATVTDERGQFRFVSLPAGEYALAVELADFDAYLEEHVLVDVAVTLERTVILKIGGIAESIAVQAGSVVDRQRPGVATRFGQEALTRIPVRRFSMFDLIRATPGVSPTSASSGGDPSVSVFGSSVNENLYLLDGTNFTCPCSGVARSEPGIDFIQEVQIQTVGASAEFGNMGRALRRPAASARARTRPSPAATPQERWASSGRTEFYSLRFRPASTIPCGTLHSVFAGTPRAPAVGVLHRGPDPVQLQPANRVRAGRQQR